jgi:hypothetical protein
VAGAGPPPSAGERQVRPGLVAHQVHRPDIERGHQLATAAVLDHRTAADRAVIDAFLDDVVVAVAAVDAAGEG